MKMKIIKKISAVLLTAAMCLSLASCSDTSYSAKSEGEAIPAGVYILAQYNALSEAMSTEGYDSTLKDVWDNKLDGKSLQTWVNDRAAEMLRQYAEVEKEFKAEGLELDEDTLKSVESQVESYWSAGEELYENIGISKDSYLLYMTNTQKYYELFNAYYGTGGKEEISDEALEAHYKDNYAQFKMISFSKTDSSGQDLDADALAALKKEADEYLAKAKDGEDFDALIAQRKKETSAGTESSDEEEEESETNNMMMVKKDEASLYVSSKLSTAIFEDAKIGEPILLSDDNAYYVVLRYNVTDDAETYQQIRQSVLYDLKGDDYDSVLEKNAENLDFEMNEAAVKKFSPKKIVKEQEKFSEKNS